MKYIIVVVASLCYCIQAIGQELLLKDFKATNNDETVLTYNLLHSQGQWPENQNGSGEASALIRVAFQDITQEEAKSFAYKTSSNMNICYGDFWEQDETKRYWIWVDSNVKNGFIEVVLPGGAVGSNRLDLPVLEPKGIYEVTLMSEKKLTINVKTLPQENVKVYIDDVYRGDGTSDIPNVKIGERHLVISYKGQERVNETIKVSESSVSFAYDFRERKKVRFESDPKNAILYVNGEEKGRTPLELELPYDNYSIRAELGPGETDQQAITVDGLSPVKIKLEPIRKKKFVVFATYNGRKVAADLYVDGKQTEGADKYSYDLEMPIGRTYNMNMMYQGDSKKRKIKVTNNMNVEQEFKIAARNSFVWPWQREYDVCPMGFSVGYVSKQLVSKGEGEKYKENGVWDDGEGKSLHGMQIGLHFQPCFSWGLGLYSGLFYEWYMSWNDNYDYNEFMEHCLYVPVHAYYRLPFANKIALSVHGGLGFNCSVYGAYTDSDDTLEDYTDFYGEDAFPKRFNMAAEIGAGFRIGPVQVNAQYSKGITNHKSYEYLGDYKTIQNKLSISVSYVFGSSN